MGICGSECTEPVQEELLPCGSVAVLDVGSPKQHLGAGGPRPYC